MEDSTEVRNDPRRLGGDTSYYRVGMPVTWVAEGKDPGERVAPVDGVVQIGAEPPRQERRDVGRLVADVETSGIAFAPPRHRKRPAQDLLALGRRR